MLLRFKCRNCNTILVARAGYYDGPISCRLCGAKTEPPRETRMSAPEPKASLGITILGSMTDDEVTTQIARKSEADARPIAWREARAAGGRSLVAGMVLTAAGAVVAALGVAGVMQDDSASWIPQSSGYVTVGLGVFAMLVGITVWRLASQTIEDEFQRRLPIVIDRIRKQYWEMHVQQHQAPSITLPGTSPASPDGALHTRPMDSGPATR